MSPLHATKPVKIGQRVTKDLNPNSRASFLTPPLERVRLSPEGSARREWGRFQALQKPLVGDVLKPEGPDVGDEFSSYFCDQTGTPR